MPVTKQAKPVADYQTWAPHELTASGQILDVFGSLGNRSSHSVTLESSTGNSMIRVNVCHKVYKQIDEFHNPFAFPGGASPRTSPLLLDEIELQKPNIIINS